MTPTGRVVVPQEVKSIRRKNTYELHCFFDDSEVTLKEVKSLRRKKAYELQLFFDDSEESEVTPKAESL